MRASLLLLFTLLAAAPKAARLAEKPVDNSEMARALDFFESEANLEALSKVSQRVLAEAPADSALIQRLLEIEIKKKDRAALIALMKKLLEANACPPARTTAKLREPCRRLMHLWTESLSRSYFFESSAVKLQQAWRLIRERNCNESFSILRELESREGLLQPISEAYVEAYKCLGDADGAAKATLQAERWKQLEGTEE